MKKEINNYQLCTQCVMDNASDTTITFNEIGKCNYCTTAYKGKKNIYFPNEQGKKKLHNLLIELKNEGKNKKYDCIMGLSGGLDSSYLLYLGYKWGLRILTVHIDDGFDTEISKKNIEKLVQATKVDYIAKHPDPKQYNALVKSFILARVPNLATPQDNLIFAYMYQYAREYKIRHFLSGGNFSLESILQRGNTYRTFDVTNIKDIHKRFGSESIDKLELLSDYRRFVDQKILRIKTHRPLNYIDYQKDKALQELNDFCGFEYYGSKHLENTLTKFIQTYWFYHKFGVDKRRSHLSSMIISDQMTREKALEHLEKPIYDEFIMQKEKNEILQKLNITAQEFDEAMSKPAKQHENYKTDWFYPIFKKFFM